MFQELTNAFRDSYKQKLLSPDQVETIWGDYLKALMTAYKAPITKHSPADWQEIYDQIDQCNKEGGMTYEDFVWRSFILTHLATEPERRGRLIINANTKIFFMSWFLTRDVGEQKGGWKNLEQIKQRSRRFNSLARLFTSLEAIPRLFPDLIPLLYPFKLKVSEIIETLPNKSCPLFPIGFAVKTCMADGLNSSPAEFAIHDWQHALLCLESFWSLVVNIDTSNPKTFVPDFYHPENLTKFWERISKNHEIYAFLLDKIRQVIRKLPEGQFKEDVAAIPMELFHEHSEDAEIVGLAISNSSKLAKFILENDSTKSVLDRKDSPYTASSYAEKFLELVAFSQDEQKIIQDFNRRRNAEYLDDVLGRNVEMELMSHAADSKLTSGAVKRKFLIEVEGNLNPGWFMSGDEVSGTTRGESKGWLHRTLLKPDYPDEESSVKNQDGKLFFEIVNVAEDLNCAHADYFMHKFKKYETARLYFDVFTAKKADSKPMPPKVVQFYSSQRNVPKGEFYTPAAGYSALNYMLCEKGLSCFGIYTLEAFPFPKETP